VIDAVAPGGRAVLVGIPAFTTRAPINPSQIVYGEKMISGTYYGSVRPNVDFPMFADLDMEKKINLDGLISRTYEFDQINEGLCWRVRSRAALSSSANGLRGTRAATTLGWTASPRFLYKSRLLGAQVAQLVEQRTENPCVGGSIPPLGTANQVDKSACYGDDGRLGRPFCIASGTTKNRGLLLVSERSQKFRATRLRQERGQGRNKNQRVANWRAAQSRWRC
jgi:hypothetical protein